MLRLARERNELRVVADQSGCPTYAPDIAFAIMKIARSLVEKPGANNLRGLFHLCGNGETTWAAFASEISQCLQKVATKESPLFRFLPLIVAPRRVVQPIPGLIRAS
jgi:dTDP-4-dehydrorhamnose reductase